MRILLGLIGCALSIALIVYRYNIKAFIGNIDWAERHLGAGGTYSLFILIALAGFFFSLMYMTNSFDLIFGGSEVDFFQSVN